MNREASNKKQWQDRKGFRKELWKRKKRYKQKENQILLRFCLFHIVLFSVFLLLFGLATAKKGSENIWHGSQTQRVTAEDIAAWVNTKWDLFFESIGDTING